MKQKEQTFEDRQQEIEMRTRKLERGRALTVNSRESDACSDAGYTAKTTRTNDLPEPQRHYSQFDSPTPAIPRGRYSYSTTHLVLHRHLCSSHIPDPSHHRLPMRIGPRRQQITQISAAASPVRRLNMGSEIYLSS